MISKKKSQLLIQIKKREEKFSRTGFHPSAGSKRGWMFLLFPVYPQTISLKNDIPFTSPEVMHLYFIQYLWKHNHSVSC